MIRLIMIDLDDSLLDDNQKISAHSKIIIEQALARGITVVLATGRMASSALPYAQELGLTTPIACCHGGIITESSSGRILRRELIPYELAVRAAQIAEAEDVYVQTYDSDAQNYYYKENCEYSNLYKRLTGVQGIPTHVPVSSFISFNPSKVLFIDTPETIQRLFGIAKQQFGSTLAIATSKPIYLEITNPNANKGNALQYIAAQYGVEKSEILAIGDGGNDLPMKQFAGTFVAMGNAHASVQQQADFVTLPNTQDGAAAAIERFALSRSVD